MHGAFSTPTPSLSFFCWPPLAFLPPASLFCFCWFYPPRCLLSWFWFLPLFLAWPFLVFSFSLCGLSRSALSVLRFLQLTEVTKNGWELSTPTTHPPLWLPPSLCFSVGGCLSLLLPGPSGTFFLRLFCRLAWQQCGLAQRQLNHNVPQIACVIQFVCFSAKLKFLATFSIFVLHCAIHSNRSFFDRIEIRMSSLNLQLL